MKEKILNTDIMINTDGTIWLLHHIQKIDKDFYIIFYKSEYEDGSGSILYPDPITELIIQDSERIGSL